jgi:phage FluMu protein Com
MTEIRCCKCNKLLGKIKGEYEIKCTRCGTMNTNKK